MIYPMRPVAPDTSGHACICAWDDGTSSRRADQPEEPKTRDRAGRRAFRDRDDEAGDIYEQQYEGRVRREKERKGHS